MLAADMSSADPTPNVDALLPLKPLVFQVLLALSDEDRHGWSLVREVQQRGGFTRLMPGNFYRTLRAMLADGLIADAPRQAAREADDDERRRYFRLTRFGARVAAAEARRLEAAVIEARAKRLLARPRG
jgi:DNA-binding PadR family transcriptional regulator